MKSKYGKINKYLKLKNFGVFELRHKRSNFSRHFVRKKNLLIKDKNEKPKIWLSEYLT